MQVASRVESKALSKQSLFADLFLTLTELQECVNSKRCLGVARGLPSDLPCQAAPLTVMQLTELHRLGARVSRHLGQGFRRGSVLFCVYSRSRWMDFPTWF